MRNANTEDCSNQGIKHIEWIHKQATYAAYFLLHSNTCAAFKSMPLFWLIRGPSANVWHEGCLTKLTPFRLKALLNAFWEVLDPPVIHSVFCNYCDPTCFLFLCLHLGAYVLLLHVRARPLLPPFLPASITMTTKNNTHTRARTDKHTRCSALVYETSA